MKYLKTKKIWNYEIQAIKEIAEYDKDCLISIEYKPNEPRAYSLLSNLGTTLLAIKEINLDNIGVTIDFAHILYSNEQPALVAALIDKHSKILGLHLNDGYGKREQNERQHNLEQHSSGVEAAAGLMGGDDHGAGSFLPSEASASSTSFVSGPAVCSGKISMS